MDNKKDKINDVVESHNEKNIINSADLYDYFNAIKMSDIKDKNEVIARAIDNLKERKELDILWFDSIEIALEHGYNFFGEQCIFEDLSDENKEFIREKCAVQVSEYERDNLNNTYPENHHSTSLKTQRI